MAQTGAWISAMKPFQATKTRLRKLGESFASHKGGIKGGKTP
jgi:hypothetical protein